MFFDQQKKNAGEVVQKKWNASEKQLMMIALSAAKAACMAV